MKAICLLDTTIFVEILNVPKMANQHYKIRRELKAKIIDSEKLFLPMATILETGNHIAQNGDGNMRRTCALKFVEEVQKALDGKSPFTPIQFLEAAQLRTWLSEFPDMAMQGLGVADLSIVKDWEQLCDRHPGRRIYIWSLDHHLQGFDRLIH